jgi:hypothetical protein
MDIGYGDFVRGLNKTDESNHSDEIFKVTRNKEICTITISYDRIEIGNTLTAWVKSYQTLID